MSHNTFRLIALSGLTASVVAITTSALAQAPAGSNWDHLKALPANTKLHVSADKGGHTCRLVSVDDAALVCGSHTFPRAEVKSVKLTRYGASYGIGTAIGAGAGAGIGVAVVSGDSLFQNDKGKAAAIGPGSRSRDRSPGYGAGRSVSRIYGLPTAIDPVQERRAAVRSARLIFA